MMGPLVLLFELLGVSIFMPGEMANANRAAVAGNVTFRKDAPIARVI
jgi:hypothetical protein